MYPEAHEDESAEAKRRDGEFALVVGVDGEESSLGVPGTVKAALLKAFDEPAGEDPEFGVSGVEAWLTAPAMGVGTGGELPYAT